MGVSCPLTTSPMARTRRISAPVGSNLYIFPKRISLAPLFLQQSVTSRLGIKGARRASIDGGGFDGVSQYVLVEIHLADADDVVRREILRGWIGREREMRAGQGRRRRC